MQVSEQQAMANWIPVLNAVRTCGARCNIESTVKQRGRIWAGYTAQEMLDELNFCIFNLKSNGYVEIIDEGKSNRAHFWSISFDNIEFSFTGKYLLEISDLSAIVST